MSEYKSCMGGMSGGLDPCTKYQVDGSKIHIFSKPEALFFVRFMKWSFLETFEFDGDTKIVQNMLKRNGSGTLMLENKKGKREGFYIHEEFEKFTKELVRHGLNINNSFYCKT